MTNDQQHDIGAEPLRQAHASSPLVASPTTSIPGSACCSARRPNLYALAKQQAGPQRVFERVAAYIAAEQRLGRLHAQRDPISVAALLLGPSYQYALLRYFMGADPLPLSDRQFVSNLV